MGSCCIYLGFIVAGIYGVLRRYFTFPNKGNFNTNYCTEKEEEISLLFYIFLCFTDDWTIGSPVLIFVSNGDAFTQVLFNFQPMTPNVLYNIWIGRLSTRYCLISLATTYYGFVAQLFFFTEILKMLLLPCLNNNL